MQTADCGATETDSFRDVVTILPVHRPTMNRDAASRAAVAVCHRRQASITSKIAMLLLNPSRAMLLAGLASLWGVAGCAQGIGMPWQNTSWQANAWQTTASTAELSQAGGSRIEMARMSEQLGRTDLAERFYRDVLEKDPQNTQAHHRLGALAAREGRWQEADQHFCQARRAGPNSAELLADIAYAQYERRNMRGAERSLRHALEVDPQHAKSRSLLALVLSEQGRFREGLAHFRQAVRGMEGHGAADGDYQAAVAAHNAPLPVESLARTERQLAVAGVGGLADEIGGAIDEALQQSQLADSPAPQPANSPGIAAAPMIEPPSAESLPSLERPSSIEPPTSVSPRTLPRGTMTGSALVQTTHTAPTHPLRDRSEGRKSKAEASNRTSEASDFKAESAEISPAIPNAPRQGLPNMTLPAAKTMSAAKTPAAKTMPALTGPLVPQPRVNARATGPVRLPPLPEEAVAGDTAHHLAGDRDSASHHGAMVHIDPPAATPLVEVAPKRRVGAAERTASRMQLKSTPPAALREVSAAEPAPKQDKSRSQPAMAAELLQPKSPSVAEQTSDDLPTAKSPAGSPAVKRSMVSPVLSTRPSAPKDEPAAAAIESPTAKGHAAPATNGVLSRAKSKTR